jgi:hypothetical protein
MGAKNPTLPSAENKVARRSVGTAPMANQIIASTNAAEPAGSAENLAFGMMSSQQFTVVEGSDDCN